MIAAASRASACSRQNGDRLLLGHGSGRNPDRLQPLRRGFSSGRSHRKLDDQLHGRGQQLTEAPSELAPPLLSRQLQGTGALLLLFHRNHSRGTHDQGPGLRGCWGDNIIQ
ncbi:unnamed protein product [Lampetra planeri]